MAGDSSDAAEVEKLYEFGERLSESKDKSQNVSDYEGIIMVVKGGSVKAKQLAAQLIPRFFKFFPSLASKALTAQFDLVEEEELGVRVQAIRGLPLLCKDNSEDVSKIVDVLGQLLIYEENVERDAVHKALMSLLRQDVKASLTALLKHVENGIENIREKVICFLKDKVFPLKAELLKPQVEMERYVTDLVKKSLQDVTGAEFKLFMDFLKSLSIFGEGAPPDRIQELIEIIEGQADLDALFNVDDIDHIDRLTSCMYMALPFFKRGASSSKFLVYFNKHIIPVFDKRLGRQGAAGCWGSDLGLPAAKRWRRRSSGGGFVGVKEGDGGDWRGAEVVDGKGGQGKGGSEDGGFEEGRRRWKEEALEVVQRAEAAAVRGGRSRRRGRTGRAAVVAANGGAGVRRRVGAAVVMGWVWCWEEEEEGRRGVSWVRWTDGGEERVRF
ncbi:uncharacterized protein A4U43_C06F11880 [Asparagus officinalis]|uniref:Apoptosis inhibitor 5 n=1 Tax=Asparagus officinalis TaxID=4686 RepID=A0A5P1EPQ0_ASPOF|nr:uncharacterized protein A4U43_C06F11880 [Asparagus officinalis]